MVTRIKRTAQFLFDNAELIAEYLSQSDNFRTVELDFRLHKHLPMSIPPEFSVEVTLYDDDAKLHGLVGHAIIKERFAQLCQMINEKSGVIPLPAPVKVRDKLEGDQNGD